MQLTILLCTLRKHKQLKGQYHEIENVYNGFQQIDQKNLVLPKQILNSFLCHFHVLIIKKHALAVYHLTVTLRRSNKRRCTNFPTAEACNFLRLLMITP